MKLIREYRKKAGLTQRELATQVGVTQSYIHALETGKRTNPSINVLLKISERMGIDVELLIEQYKEAV